jgi:hypothetical protein
VIALGMACVFAVMFVLVAASFVSDRRTHSDHYHREAAHARLLSELERYDEG